MLKTYPFLNRRCLVTTIVTYSPTCFPVFIQAPTSFFFPYRILKSQICLISCKSYPSSGAKYFFLPRPIEGLSRTHSSNLSFDKLLTYTS